jgi:hypothetical protein
MIKHRNMNRLTLRYILLAVLASMLVLPLNAQRSRVKVYSSSADRENCMPNLSAYRTFLKLKRYEDAQPTWLKVFETCPDSSELVYVDGANMYRYFIENTPAGPLREGRIDTLMLIYDRRMEYFGGEGNVLGRKAADILAFRGSDLSLVKEANGMLRKSIQLEGLESRDKVMQLCISSGVVLNKKGLIEEKQIIADYVMILGNLVELQKESSRWGRIRARIDQQLIKENILSCKALDTHFAPLMEQNKSEIAFQETLLSSYQALECDRSDILVAATESMYRLAPSAESAHDLAMQFISRNELETAASYLRLALESENIPDGERAQWNYELALVSNGLQDYCQAIDYARKAIQLNTNFGQAYILLGDAFIESRKSLGDDFQKRAAYWIAADMYEKAESVDPAQAEEARKKLLRSSAQFPDKEDIFFRDIREGEAYLVEGCINGTTTVRSRK